MYNYAILNSDGYCEGYSQLSGEVNLPHMIRLGDDEDLGAYLGRRLVDGVWEDVEL
jgi:hypothetical protein